ncbi:hypothetical protein FAZ78_16935 [Cereibacter changlensis]|uniref:Uncharacterized protein n=1 Tax=Cereibacter changlensis TaxID=402884 RepID=A0A4U0YS96_9RHOB|nr:hypothetical protein [Cereibacter changlensis]TKA95420.1 hypothetical protein FAZ78_16935 [Cereibacter changlensis]
MSDGAIGTILVLLLSLLSFVFVVWFFILLPADMANDRGRSQFGWVLVSLFFSPFAAIFLLLLIGAKIEVAE